MNSSLWCVIGMLIGFILGIVLMIVIALVLAPREKDLDEMYQLMCDSDDDEEEPDGENK